jgi:hypothetical protein
MFVYGYNSDNISINSQDRCSRYKLGIGVSLIGPDADN